MSLIFTTRSTISTWDLSEVHPSRSCRANRGRGCFPGCCTRVHLDREELLVTHSIRHHLQVDPLQLVSHLSVAMAVPAVKVGRLEELPVVPEGINQVSFCRSHAHSGPLPDRKGCGSPVQARPITSEQRRELRPGVIQTGQKLVLAERAEQGRSLNTQPGRVRGQQQADTLPSTSCYLPGGHRSLQRHQAGQVALLEEHTGLVCVCVCVKAAAASPGG